ncbi:MULTISPECIES: 3-deoxy-8-phosphooctulonate synthase [unclassified Oceanispirochaeta]|uniref:3-deoxy-8-phosphooctulonate synthase n=1 Tax=unclassified Oceanispirochaeta TaxID=2635722 RepID=UPI000E09A021|nr:MULTISPECIES: 3-deoxy-8-phosphooctulonate synthase [unclassified Oceanispirochaeta]MBF9014412.1 3-deoxy-8-phosphooctulonate synthase [Oceanispirochaeta sp. M2]NPD71298.1 3-deoxy-8-phosphooctulonate synthase [Oceanispirochaeta sp. M1]RDG33679.1 3-deoxy-8-phosphooctulonate synthase [Oceanispirochaeta sp. M1]
MNSYELYNELKKNRFIISGPCVIENETMIMKLAEIIKRISIEHGFIYVFKASFDKANRTSLDSFRGPGIDEGLKILEKVKKEFELPITTDIHESSQAAVVSDVVDIIQIPAFLCRQTDLLVAAAKTDRIVNIKKAQFLDGKDMLYPINKVKDSGNDKIMLTERGSIFGMGNLVVDFRQLIDMKDFGYPVIMDVTHSTQKPGGLGGKSGGDSSYSPYMAKLANAIDVNGFFFEVHEDPTKALSDGPNMITPSQLESILDKIK